MKTKVVNIKYDEYDVFIGRPSEWGNPFEIGKDGNRQQVIKKYEEWIKKQPNLMNNLYELRGKKLGCFCHPLACHGDILVKLIEGVDNNVIQEDKDFEWKSQDANQ